MEHYSIYSINSVDPDQLASEDDALSLSQQFFSLVAMFFFLGFYTVLRFSF